MSDRKQYPRVLHAVESIELGKWPLVDALLDEVETDSRDTRARPGEFERVVQFLRDRDHGDYSISTLKELFYVGRWVESATETRARVFREYPVSLVRVAHYAAKKDHAEALRILAEKSSFRQIEGRPSERRPKSPLEKLSRATFAAWEVQEHLMEDGLDLADEDRVLIISLAEKLQRLGGIIVQQAEAGSTRIDLDLFFQELEEFKAVQ